MNGLPAAPSVWLHRIGKRMLLSDDLADFSARWPEIAQCFQSQKAYEVARGTHRN
jgi:hypothetical protein